MKHTITFGIIEQVHAAWKDAATNAEPGATRLLFTRGMKALRPAMGEYQTERNQLTIDYALRDEHKALVPMRGADDKPIPGQFIVEDGPAYLLKLQQLNALVVEVELPGLTDDLLALTSANEESLALLLDYLEPLAPTAADP